MLHLVNLERAYSPETVAIMTAAFDRVCQSVSYRMNGDEELKRKLALIILRHVDRGVRNVQRLADVALQEWTGLDRSATVFQFGAKRHSPERGDAASAAHPRGIGHDS
jgi:hypothetical protein